MFALKTKNGGNIGFFSLSKSAPVPLFQTDFDVLWLKMLARALNQDSKFKRAFYNCHLRFFSYVEF